MAHFRLRHLEAPFQKLIRNTRILGVLGHRQVGKTTFLQAHSNEYVTLDEQAALTKALKDPEEFISSLKGKKSAIDECQLAPGLFPALKVRVGTLQTPGQFILSGSVRFTSREAIRESLTGRISNLEMYPLVLSELAQDQNADFFLKIQEANSLSSFSKNLQVVATLHRQRNQLIDKYLEMGGLPGICFVRSIATRKNLLKDLIETILDRDIRLVYPTTLPYQDIYAFCQEIAKRPGEMINLSELKRLTGISLVTQKKLLRALEGVFLLRRIHTDGDFKGESFWFEDQVERHALAGDDTIADSDWITLVYRNARAQFGYTLGEFPQYSQFLTRGGARVPLVIQNKNKRLGVFSFSSEDQINRSTISSAESFLGKYESARVVFLVKDTKEVRLISDRILMVPLSAALFK